MVPDVTVAVFARAPVIGQVKTRLAQDLGAREALCVHRALLERTLAVVSAGAAWTAELWLAGDTDSMGEVALPVLAQVDGDLGQRMCASARDIVARGSWVVIVGCDCPVMSVAYIGQAIAALERGHDVVFGPAEDGGYALIGLRRSHPRLFDDIAWSTSSVLEQSLERAAELDLSVALLDMVWDVDTVEDWRRWRREVDQAR